MIEIDRYLPLTISIAGLSKDDEYINFILIYNLIIMSYIPMVMSVLLILLCILSCLAGVIFEFIIIYFKILIIMYEKIIKLEFGLFVAFPTSKNTPHGFSRIKKGKRIGINSYFYSDSPLDERTEPSKTDWIKII